ncbi:MAG: hypothetical protein JRG97_11305, partial [Deltaproteobacteria bacterium]|nr:hypothetical protein [Deltaproteobacteria bacterium]
FVETDEERKAAEALLLKTRQEPDKWQAEINKIEAGHRSLFVAGWRPFIGWICGLGLAWKFAFSPICFYIQSLMGLTAAMPDVQTGDLIPLVMALLGLGSIRSWEKARGLTR